MRNQLTLQKFNIYRVWLIVLLGLFLTGFGFVPSASAQQPQQITSNSQNSLTGVIIFQTNSGGPIYAVDASTLTDTAIPICAI